MASTPRPAGVPFLRLDRTRWSGEAEYRQLVVERSTGALRLGRQGQHAIPAHEPFGSFGGRTMVRGLAVWPDGHVFMVDPGGNRVLVFRNPYGDAERPTGAADHWPFRPLWEPTPDAPADGDQECAPGKSEAEVADGAAAGGTDPYRLRAPADVARAPNGDLVVVDSGNARLVVFTWPELRVRDVVRLPGWSPRAITFDARGRGLVADPGHRRVWRFDALWRLDPAFGGGPGLVAPEHIAVSAEGTGFVVDAGTQRVVQLDAAGRPLPVPEPVPPALFDSVLPPALEWTGDALVYRAPGRSGCAPLVMRGVRPDRRGMLERTQLPLVPRSVRIALPRSGAFTSEPLDSTIAGFRWDRVVLDADVPEATKVLVTTLTAEEPLSRERVEAEMTAAAAGALELGAANVPEVLVQSAPGRYLWLRLELLGDGERTPAVRRIDVHGPRSSSLGLLPPPYHEIEESADFLDRFLSYFDTVYAEIEARLADVTRLLDPYAVDAGEFLDWLGAWFDWQFLAEWPEATRRAMVAEAVAHFRERGTVHGLRRMVQWHTGVGEPFPHVIEHFRLREYAARRLVAEPDHPAGRPYIGGRPLNPGHAGLSHRFTVVLPGSAAADNTAHARLVRVIEAQKPAHTGFELRTLKPGVRIACQSTVGVDTWLGDYPADVLGRMALGADARLETAQPGGPRLGSSFLSD
jgi:phage tail-like protein